MSANKKSIQDNIKEKISSNVKKEEIKGKDFDRLEKAEDLKKAEEDKKAKEDLKKAKESAANKTMKFVFKADTKVSSVMVEAKRLIPGKDATAKNPYETSDMRMAKALEQSAYFNIVK